LRVFRGRILLLGKPVRDSERKCIPIIREDQGKAKKQGNILEYRMEELGPMGSPPGRPTYCALMLLPLGPRVINLLTRFIHNWMNAGRLQLVKQYHRLPLDDSPKMVIRDYEK
jgi:hypothetical protein